MKAVKKELELELKALQNELEIYAAIEMILHDDKQKLIVKIRDLDDGLVQAATREEELKQMLQNTTMDMESKIDDIETQLEENETFLQNAQDILEIEIRDKNDEIAALEKDQEEILKTTTESFLTKVEDLQQQLRMKTATQTVLENTQQMQEIEIEKLMIQLEENETELEKELKNTKEDSRTTVENLRTQVEIMASKEANLEEARQKLENKTVEIQNQLDVSSVQMIELEQTLKIATEEWKAMEQVLKNQLIQTTANENELLSIKEDLEKRSIDVKKQLETKTNTENLLKNTQKKLEVEIKHLNEMLVQGAVLGNELKNNLVFTTEELKSREKELRESELRYDGRIEILEEEKNDLKNKLKFLKVSIGAGICALLLCSYN